MAIGARKGKGEELLVPVFVYGTLQPEAEKAGGKRAMVWGRIWTNGDYPALELDNPGCGRKVQGVVYWVTAAKLHQLDGREGAASGWYNRVEATTLRGTDVFVYEGGRCLRPDGPEGPIAPRWRPVKPNRRGIAHFIPPKVYWRDRLAYRPAQRQPCRVEVPGLYAVGPLGQLRACFDEERLLRDLRQAAELGSEEAARLAEDLEAAMAYEEQEEPEVEEEDLGDFANLLSMSDAEWERYTRQA